MKTCVKCGEKKELELFSKGKQYKDGRRGTCKQCHSNYMVNYYRVNPDKIEQKRKLNSGHGVNVNWKRHHITKEQFDKLLSIYDGKCHSCKDRKAVSIDHDHSCCSSRWSCGNCIRGILCNQCNTALGLLNDDVKKIKNLIKYIGL